MNAAVPRFNPWPYAIIATFVVFISGTVALIVIAQSSRSELVARDYYEQEIRYQGQLDQMNRAQPWDSRIEVAAPATPGLPVTLAFPQELASRGVKGSIELYRPSEAGRDTTLPLALDISGRQAIPSADLAPGLWKLRLRWQVGDDTYYSDRKLVIPAADSR